MGDNDKINTNKDDKLDFNQVCESGLTASTDLNTITKEYINKLDRLKDSFETELNSVFKSLKSSATINLEFSKILEDSTNKYKNNLKTQQLTENNFERFNDWLNEIRGLVNTRIDYRKQVITDFKDFRNKIKLNMKTMREEVSNYEKNSKEVFVDFDKTTKAYFKQLHSEKSDFPKAQDNEIELCDKCGGKIFSQDKFCQTCGLKI